jgi:hypothetical protein
MGPRVRVLFGVTAAFEGLRAGAGTFRALLLLTIRAAPLMWRIGSSPDDPTTLAALADAFVAWTLPRIVLADLSFAMVLTAIFLAMPIASAHQKTVAANRSIVGGPAT